MVPGLQKRKTRSITPFVLLLLIPIIFSGCKSGTPKGGDLPAVRENISLILDTYANNEIDDQHAIAYMLFNNEYFDIKGLTVNETWSGGSINSHIEEAKRIVKLCGYENSVEVIEGASDDYHEVIDSIGKPDYDGKKAVDFIVKTAREERDQKLVLVAIGKLTNISLALEKAPDISKKIRLVWLGSNWPAGGEYNLENDTSALAPLLHNDDLEFEILTVRYGEPSGTDAVSLSVEEVQRNMKGLGPVVEPVEGRHGGAFTCFGRFLLSLFRFATLHFTKREEKPSTTW